MRKTRSIAFDKPCRICIALLILMMFFSYGCGGDSEDYVSVREGRFVDSPVEGLTYICGKQTGITNENGTFFYEKGKDITFKLGNIVFGSVSTTLRLPLGEESPAILTFSPRDLVPEAESNRDPEVTNILQFLQTLDEDYDPDNGIFLSESVRKEAEKYSTEIDFSLSPDEFETSIQPVVNDLLDEERELVSRVKAQNHFMRTLVQDILDNAVKNHNVPGVALVTETPCSGDDCINGEMDGVTYENGKFVWKLTSGYTDLENQIPMTTDSRFRIASLTKTFVAMTILKLVEEGTMSLDDSVEHWLPGIIPDGENIAIRQVMNHSSGLFNFYEIPSEWFLDFLFDPYRTWKQTELIDISVENGPIFPPGMGWHYSNTNYVLLGMVIEAVTGNAWEDVIRERFIKKYELDNTIVPETGEAELGGEYAQIENPDFPPYTRDAIYAYGYIDLHDLTGGMYGEPGEILQKAFDREPSSIGSSGNMMSTPENLYRWIKLIGEGRLFGEDADFVNDNVDEELFFQLYSYLSCGPNIYRNTNNNMLIASGNFPGYDVGIVYSLDDNIPIAACSNRTLRSGDGQIKDLVIFDAIAVLGGGLSSDDPAVVKQGIFLDSAVEGLDYVSGDQAGVTDEQGTFMYEEGKTVTFKIGDIVIGQGVGKTEMTPIDLVPGATNEMDQTVTNIIRLLQTLDADQNPDNGIMIEDNEGYDNTTLDFSLSSEAFEPAGESLVDGIFDNQRDLILAKDAQTHFRCTLLTIPGTEMAQKVQKILDDAVADNAIPGAVATFLNSDGRQWTGTSGNAFVGTDTEEAVPASPGDRFRIASVTKSFVAMTLLQLAQEEKIALDDSVEMWLPGIVPNGENITVRQLLNHTSGIYNFYEGGDNDWYMAMLTEPETTWTPLELVNIAVTNKGNPYFPPGEGWFYSNTNYVLAGMIIEVVTGNAFENEIETRFIEKYGLTDTLAPKTGEATIPGTYAHGYYSWYEATAGMAGGSPEDPLTEHSVQDPSFVSSSGNMISTTGDLARWIRMVGEGELLNEEFQNELRSCFTFAEGICAALGLFDNSHYGGVLGIPGQLLGYDISTWYQAENNIAISAGANRTIAEGRKIQDFVTWPILALLAGEEYTQSGDSGHSERRVPSSKELWYPF